jgi:hypothetical protein
LHKQLNINNLKKGKTKNDFAFFIFFMKSVGAKKNICTFAAQFKGILE